MASEAAFEGLPTNDTAEVFNLVLNLEAKLPGCECRPIHAAEPRNAVFDTDWRTATVRGQRHQRYCVFARTKRELQGKSVAAEHTGNGDIDTGFVRPIMERLAAFPIVKCQTVELFPQREISR